MTPLQRLEAAAAWGALALLRTLGPVASSNLCGAVARRIGPMLPVSRVAEANLRAALPALSVAERAHVVRGVWENLGRTVGELPHLAALGITASGPGIEPVGMAPITAMTGPVVLVSAHFGNWEVLPRLAALLGVRLGLFYRAAGNPAVDRLIVNLRERAAAPLAKTEVAGRAPAFAKGAAGARSALRHLTQGGKLAMLVDQKMNDGITASFFGRVAMTAPAAAAFALRFGCPVIPVRCERLGPARWRVTAELPVPMPATGDRHRDIALMTQAINDRLEAWVRARPDHWLWLHRRWPSDVASPPRPVENR